MFSDFRIRGLWGSVGGGVVGIGGLLGCIPKRTTVKRRTTIIQGLPGFETNCRCEALDSNPPEGQTTVLTPPVHPVGAGHRVCVSPSVSVSVVVPVPMSV